MPLSTLEPVTLITDEETGEIEGIGTLYIDEDEFGLASEMAIESYDHDRLDQLELYFQGADEPFLPRYFTERVGMAFGDFGGEEERVGTTFAALRQSAPDPDDVDPALILRVVIDVHKLVAKVRRQQPVVVPSGSGWPRYELDHQVEGSSSDVLAVTQFGRVELTAVVADDSEPTQFTNATLDAWLRGDGRLVGSQSFFGVAQSASREQLPFYVDETGDIYAHQNGATTRIAWSNIMSRDLAKEEGCFFLLETGRIIPMTTSISARELKIDGGR